MPEVVAAVLIKSGKMFHKMLGIQSFVSRLTVAINQVRILRLGSTVDSKFVQAWMPYEGQSYNYRLAVSFNLNVNAYHVCHECADKEQSA